MAGDSGGRWGLASEAAFVRRVLIVIGLVALALLAWQLSDVLLLAFGAVLVAVILHAAADLLARRTPVPERWALTAATILLFALLAGILILFGAQVRGQIAGVAERLPGAVDSVTRELGLGDVSGRMPEMLGSAGGFVARLAGIGGTILNGVADFVLVVIAGLYIAANPKIHRVGLVKLFPKGQHDRVEDSLDAAGEALKLWLVAQLVAMACVGTLATVALMLLGVPSALALGLIAALADFVPFVGPILGALPAVLIAATMGGETVLWTILAFVVIQQIEGNVVFPLVGKRMVSLPPALALFAIMAGGALFGIIGLVVGFPLAVVVYVLVKKLYVRETLGESTPVPGEKENPGVGAS